MIPRIFHQIWLGDDAFPAEYSRRQATWLHHHPGWELRFWTEKSLPARQDLRRVEASERLRAPWERTDVLRLEILWRFGGVYVDPDLECLRSIEPLIENATFLIGKSNRGRVETALIASVAGHPILDRALDEIRPREYPGYDRSATGSRFLDRVLAAESGVTYVNRALLNPSRPKDVEQAFAVGGVGEWESLDRLWQSLVKSERRLAAAQGEASRWRAMYRTAAADVPSPDELADEHGATSVEAPAERPAVRVPRIFHQIWLGPKPFPEEYAAYQQTWLRHHPGWEMRLWTEDNLPKPLRRPEAAERLRIPAERGDILRLEVVWRFGGVHLDTDLECLRPIEELIGEASFFTALSGSGVTNFYFFGAVAGHPILDHALDRIRPRKRFGHDKTRTGPRFQNTVIAEHRDEILLLDPPTLKAYTVHHQHRTYLDSEALRVDLHRTKLEMLAALQGNHAD